MKGEIQHEEEGQKSYNPAGEGSEREGDWEIRGEREGHFHSRGSDQPVRSSGPCSQQTIRKGERESDQKNYYGNRRESQLGPSVWEKKLANAYRENSETTVSAFQQSLKWK